MSVTFIIGNGFDLNVGLKTRYTDFYKGYTSKTTDDNNIRRFRNDILKSKGDAWSNWADFEYYIGQYSRAFEIMSNPARAFEDCLDDFTEEFMIYLRKECKKINWPNVRPDALEKFRHSIHSFYKYADENNDVEDNIWVNSPVHVLQLNYTDVFDQLVEKSNSIHQIKKSYRLVDPNVHIHGTMKKNGNSIMGVSSKPQILNKAIRDDENACRSFVKTEFYTNLKNTVKEAVNDCTAVCIFGASIGATDAHIWEVLGDWLSVKGSDVRQLFIFDICGKLSSDRAYKKKIEARKKDMLNNFFTHAGIKNESDIAYLTKKINFGFDTDIFNIQLVDI